MIHAGAALRRTLHAYGENISAFSRNARLYLAYLAVTSVGMGVFRLLVNFYVLSRGFDEAFLGKLVTAGSVTALIVALPMGYLGDILGRKRSLLLSAALTVASVAMMVLLPGAGMLLAANVVLGAAQSLASVTGSPFLVENSGERERTYLFSLSSGLGMAAASVGNWVGGYMPTWVAGARGVPATSVTAYGGALLIIAGAGALGLVPLVMLRATVARRSERTAFAPVTYARRHPALLAKLILPMLVTSVGAGLIMPFMNVFFRQVHGKPDPVIGALFAWGSLSMGLGFIVAPPLADRLGKIRLVVITQALSIPFLFLLGFSPWFELSIAAYLVRVALMNMSAPVYQTFVMERVEPSARATVASLASMAWNFGWAFSPAISGVLQVRYGFGPPFALTIVLYAVSTALYWAFFWRGVRVAEAEGPAGAGAAPS